MAELRKSSLTILSPKYHARVPQRDQQSLSRNPERGRTEKVADVRMTFRRNGQHKTARGERAIDVGVRAVELPAKTIEAEVSSLRIKAEHVPRLGKRLNVAEGYLARRRQTKIESPQLQQETADSMSWVLELESGARGTGQPGVKPDYAHATRTPVDERAQLTAMNESCGQRESLPDRVFHEADDVKACISARSSIRTTWRSHKQHQCPWKQTRARETRWPCACSHTEFVKVAGDCVGFTGERESVGNARERHVTMCGMKHMLQGGSRRVNIGHVWAFDVGAKCRNKITNFFSTVTDDRPDWPLGLGHGGAHRSEQGANPGGTENYESNSLMVKSTSS